MTSSADIDDGVVEAERLGRRPALDGLRGLAILAVVAFHTELPLTHGGYLGVTAFFVLSGFLITTLLLEEQRDHRRVGLRRFYARRAVRLFPALWTLFLAVGTWAVVTGSTRLEVRRIAAAFLYAANWVRALNIDSMGDLSHTWSLAIEEQFYLLWPLLLIPLARRRNPTALMATTTGLTVASVASRLLLFGPGTAAWHRVQAGLDTRSDALLIGCLAAALFHWRGSRRRWPARLIPAAVGLAAGTQLFTTEATTWMVLVGYTLVAAATAVVVLYVVGSPGAPLARLLAVRPLTWLGDISYSLYLWHVPVLYYLHLRTSWSLPAVAAAGVPLSLVLAVASNRLVERRFLTLRARLRRPDRTADRPDRVAAWPPVEPGNGALEPAR